MNFLKLLLLSARNWGFCPFHLLLHILQAMTYTPLGRRSVRRPGSDGFLKLEGGRIPDSGSEEEGENQTQLIVVGMLI